MISSCRYFVVSGLRVYMEVFALNDCLRRCLAFPLPIAPVGRASPSPNKVPIREQGRPNCTGLAFASVASG